MFFDQMNQGGQQNPLAALSAVGGGAGGGGLASLIAMLAARGGAGGMGSGMAPQMPQPGAVPQSGPMPGAIPPVQQPGGGGGGGILQMLMQMDPQRLRQMMGMVGGGMGSGPFTNGSPGLVNNLLASRDFGSMGQGGAY